MKNFPIFYFIILLNLNFYGQPIIEKDSINVIQHKYTNQLINETSPYLLQHAHNPVNWLPWGKEALDKAKNENKLIIISIGYSACHWCHVMEKESFENEEVASFMNENFISIKIDKEERPDIDQIYLKAVQLMNGNGGWPLNCITLPDGRPIYGGTYFTKEKWMEMLNYILDFTKNNPKNTENQAVKIHKGIQANEMSKLIDNSNISLNDLNETFLNLKSYVDFENGGFFGSAKFPYPNSFEFLLQYNFLLKNDEALKAVTITLDKIASGGIYDHIGGGFSRYSTDENWKVPHFEKMLYDNAQLVSLFSNAFKVTKKPNYKKVVIETLEFIERELISKDGGFYTSIDADSEGEEGKYYVWSKSEIAQILNTKDDLYFDYYNITKKGNWENGNNILHKSNNIDKLLSKNKINNFQLEKMISDYNKMLLYERNCRIKPKRDDKIITAWNALMLKAYVDAFSAFKNEEHLNRAIKNAEFIITNIKSSDNRLNRNIMDNKSSINAFLDDYAFTIEAFISLYQVTFDEKWLTEAKLLMDYTIKHFYNLSIGMFYYTSDIDARLITRKYELSDTVIPASNAVMAKNLFKLGKLLNTESYVYISKTMLNNIKFIIKQSGIYYASWASLLALIIYEPYEVVILGEKYKSKLESFNEKYNPNIILSGGKTEGNLELHKNKAIPNNTIIYVCHKKTCKPPVNEVEEAIKLMVK